jgi:hypothetical protein
MLSCNTWSPVNGWSHWRNLPGNINNYHYLIHKFPFQFQVPYSWLVD